MKSIIACVDRRPAARRTLSKFEPDIAGNSASAEAPGVDRVTQSVMGSPL